MVLSVTTTTCSTSPRTPRTGLGSPADAELCAIVAAASRGDASAWDILVRRFGNMVKAVARSCRLDDADVADVQQMTWLRLVENIGRIEHPERIGPWLATTAKREGLRVVRAHQRVVPDHDVLAGSADPDDLPLDAGPLAAERSVLLHQAFALLPPHCKRLLGVMARDDPPSYREISALLSMPIGSIGPTRGRCLDHLRRILAQLEGGAHRGDHFEMARRGAQ